MRRLNQFEILRFIGAIVVLLYHTARETTFFHKLPIILQNGTVWVYFYFLLSGFMLSYTYFNKKINIKDFYISRIIKLYPLYFFSLFIICIFTGFKGKEKMLYHIFLLQDWIFTKALDYNAAAWYLSTLAFLYLIFPFLLKLFQKYKKTMIIISVVSSLYSYYLYIVFLSSMYQEKNEKVHQLFNYFPVIHISSFMLGIALCVVCFKIKERKVYSYLSIFYIVFLTYFMNNIPNGFVYAGTIVTISFIPLVLFFSKDVGFLSKILGNKIFIFLGGLSYSIYILHVPMQEIFKNKISDSINNEYFISYFIITIIMAVVSFFLIERVFGRYLSKKYIENKNKSL